MGTRTSGSLTVVTEAPVSNKEQPLGVAGTSSLQAVEHQCVSKCGAISHLVVIPASISRHQPARRGLEHYGKDQIWQWCRNSGFTRHAHRIGNAKNKGIVQGDVKAYGVFGIRFASTTVCRTCSTSTASHVNLRDLGVQS